MKWHKKFIAIVSLIAALAACSSETHYAPVTDIAAIERIPRNGTYHVSSGETLYSIAWRYGQDYRYLAKLNHMSPPYHVVSGQRIYLSDKLFSISKNQSKKIIQNSAPVHVVEREPNTLVLKWNWPASGPLTQGYSQLNKGINIGGHVGTSIYATAPGIVVYSGNGLRGYGNLIIIKHNSHYLSAYAYNSLVFVREGQRVNAHQKIAEMGSFNLHQAMLHFELRKNGQPVNPLNYLKT
ncbi:MAG TPA: peptidoglycan DD-metalloendopeptidase family protein [Gammaproteobacteria bacterium]|nr:peptidoglycan DD-metalloendopeptidase family protein [Gammaproteobacteria bacterium]